MYISIYHLLWIVPLSILLGAFFTALLLWIWDDSDRE